MKSEKPWFISSTFNNVTSELKVNPEKKANASVYQCANEQLILYGKQELSPFGLSLFKTTFTADANNAQKIKIGVLVT
jgi:hypothetical protein